MPCLDRDRTGLVIDRLFDIFDEDGNGVADTVPPTDKDDWKKGGWATFDNPSFPNQGQCIKYVNTGK